MEEPEPPPTPPSGSMFNTQKQSSYTKIKKELSITAAATSSLCTGFESQCCTGCYSSTSICSIDYTSGLILSNERISAPETRKTKIINIQRQKEYRHLIYPIVVKEYFSHKGNIHNNVFINTEDTFYNNKIHEY